MAVTDKGIARECAEAYLEEMGTLLPGGCHKGWRAYLLPGGLIYEIAVPRIETHLCFGWGSQGSTAEEAERMADAARTKETWFLERNRKGTQIQRDTDLLNDPHARPVLYVKYRGGHRVVGVADIARQPLLCPYLAEVTDADRKVMLAALEQERERFERRLAAYLRRYGLSKLKVWTYWQDR